MFTMLLINTTRMKNVQLLQLQRILWLLHCRSLQLYLVVVLYLSLYVLIVDRILDRVI